MNIPKPVAISAGIGAVIAIALIVATVYVLPGIGDLTQVSTTTRVTTVTTTSSSTSSSGPSGTLSALLTDPPTVPLGTTDLYMNYSSISVHEAGLGNASQYWLTVGGSGVIDLMQTVNISQTIGLAAIPAGVSFDLIAFNVSSVIITFQGENYSAAMVNADKRIVEVIPGSMEVGIAQTQAVLIDMSPKVLELGSSPSIAFAFLPSARAFVVPTEDIPAQAHVLGGRSNLELNPWWKSVAVLTHFEVTGVALSPNFLQINVTNTGNTSVTFKLVTVTSTLNSTYGPSIPPFQTSAVFSINSNGTLTTLSGSNKSAILDNLSSDGYVLSPHATVTFSFSSSIRIGLIQFSNETLASSALAFNQPYTIRLFGNDNVAYTDITG